MNETLKEVLIAVGTVLGTIVIFAVLFILGNGFIAEMVATR
jgi:hypothetical protein